MMLVIFHSVIILKLNVQDLNSMSAKMAEIMKEKIEE